MKKIQLTLLSAVILISSNALSDTYTWDGGGTDNNWSTAANWNPDGAPQSATNTTVQLAGPTRLSPVQNIADPFILNRLEYLTFTNPESGAFSLSGNQIQVQTNGVTQPRIYLSRRATCNLNNDLDIPAGTTLTLQIGTYGLNMNGLISGEGSIVKTSDSGGITLNHTDNTFSGGLLIHANRSDWAKFNVKKSGAMGTGPVTLNGGTISTAYNNPGGLIFYDTSTHTNTVLLSSTSPIFVGMPNNDDDVVTLNGDIDLNSYTLYLRGGSQGTINGVISEGAADAIIKVDPGTWTLGGNNSFTGDLTINDGTIKLGISDALDTSVDLVLSGEGGTFDLDGNDQTLNSLTGETGAGAVNTLTSTAAATLTLNQSADTIFDGKVSGALTLVKADSGSLTFTNNQSDTTGSIIISNGPVVVASGANLDCAVTVAGGSLVLTADNALGDSTSLSIENGATSTLSGTAAETVDKLFLNGSQQERGTYGATGSGAMFINDTYFSGTGVLYVESNPPISAVDTTWDDEGTDTSVSTAENWTGDALPAFDGTTHAIFATAGDTASVDTNMNLYGLTFNRDNNFTLAEDSGIITNGAGGITAQSPATSSRSYTIAEDMVLSDKQSWNISNNGSATTTLSLNGHIDDGILPCNITKTGNGRLRLTSSNAFDGTFTSENGIIDVSDSHALGSTNGNTIIKGYLGSRLRLYNSVDINEPLYLHGEKDNAGTLDSEGGGINTISGPVTCESQIRIRAYNAGLVFSGGVTAADPDGLFVLNSGHTITFTNEPLNLAGRTFWSDSGGLTVLAVTNNIWSDTMVASGTLRCGFPHVLPTNSSLRVGVWYGPNGTLDMNGNDQTISRLYDNTHVPGNRRITSSTPALLTINQSANSSYNGTFEGAVSVLKLGSGTLTLTNAFTSTTGSFIISNGTLTAGNMGTFGANCTNIVVADSGALVLENSNTIANFGSLTINDDTQVTLAAGINETIGYLTINGVSMPVGTHGITGSGAEFTDDTHFAGTGILKVLRSRRPGTVIVVR